MNKHPFSESSGEICDPFEWKPTSGRLDCWPWWRSAFTECPSSILCFSHTVSPVPLFNPFSILLLWPVPMMVPKTTSETLKHKINPSVDLAEPQTVHVLLYTPGMWWNLQCLFIFIAHLSHSMSPHCLLVYIHCSQFKATKKLLCNSNEFMCSHTEHRDYHALCKCLYGSRGSSETFPHNLIILVVLRVSKQDKSSLC